MDEVEPLQLIMDFVPEQIFADVDPDKIEYILHYLINKAIKFTPNGGEMRIIARIEATMEGFPLGALLMGVKDQGMGILQWLLKKTDEASAHLAWVQNKERNNSHENAEETSLSKARGYLLVRLLLERHGGICGWRAAGRIPGLQSGSVFR